MYLQHILKQKETSLVKQFLKTQMKNLKIKDLGKTILENLEHLKMELSIKENEEMPKATNRKMLKKRIKEEAFIYI